MKSFSNIYDRLGKFLHADNPWGNDKQRQNTVNDIQMCIPKLRELLILHGTFIRTKNYSKVWVVEIPQNNNKPQVVTGIASGDFTIK